MTERDRKALKLGVPVIGLMGLAMAYLYMGPEGSAAANATPAQATKESVEMAEQRLARLKDIAAAAPAKQEILAKVTAELAAREKGLIRAATAQQAQAQVISIVREQLSIEGVDIRSTEMGAVEALGNGHGLAPVRVTFECAVSQLLNVLAGLESRPELLSTRDLQILAGDPRGKTVRVTLTVVGAVPRELVPEKDKKGVAGL